MFSGHQAGRRGQTGLSTAALDWLSPVWQQPGVRALMTTRNGGVSAPPFNSMNLRRGIGDDEAAVARNVDILHSQTGARPVWLDQVHGNRVVRLVLDDTRPDAPMHRADASVCSVPGIACVVQVADCLPVLMAARGRAVAAAHAGWRGLAAGIVGATVQHLCEAADCEPGEIEAWLGACIGPRQFEVGGDVLKAFGVEPSALAVDATARQARFRARGPAHPDKWLADLAALATDELAAAGVGQVTSADQCTVEQSSRFFSYRRDGVTGRMAAGIWLEWQ